MSTYICLNDERDNIYIAAIRRYPGLILFVFISNLLGIYLDRTIFSLTNVVLMRRVILWQCQVSMKGTVGIIFICSYISMTKQQHTCGTCNIHTCGSYLYIYMNVYSYRFQKDDNFET
jgi:hypothetical protein